MNRPDFFKQPDAGQLAGRVAGLQVQLRAVEKAIGAEMLAARSGSELQLDPGGGGRFILAHWNQLVQIRFPDWIASDGLSGETLAVPSQALLLYYFVTADGQTPDRRWISFADLPDGRFYNQAFQGYTGRELGRAFQNDLDAFEHAARDLDGILQDKGANTPGERAYLFQPLPRLATLAAYWSGDEDFPASAQILFEASAPHYLPTDVCAILGSTLTRRLIKLLGRR